MLLLFCRAGEEQQRSRLAGAQGRESKGQKKEELGGLRPHKCPGGWQSQRNPSNPPSQGPPTFINVRKKKKAETNIAGSEAGLFSWQPAILKELFSSYFQSQIWRSQEVVLSVPKVTQ